MKRSGWLFSLLIGLVLPAGPLPADCVNEIVSETFSPNGRFKAVVFVRDCGQGRRNVHLSVLPAFTVLPPEPGNTFVGEESLSRAERSDRLAVQVQWLGPSELSVLHGVVRRLRHEGRVNGFRVYYGHLVDLPPRFPL